jgi:hypothetical protein
MNEAPKPVPKPAPKPEPKPEPKPVPKPGSKAAISHEPDKSVVNNIADSALTYSKKNKYTSLGQKRFPASSTSKKYRDFSQANVIVDSKKVVKEDTACAKATLGISYFKSMMKNDTKDLRVSAVFNGDLNLVRSKIREIEAKEYEGVSKNDSSTIRIVKDIKVIKQMKVILQYDSAQFKITRVPPDATDNRKLDLDHGINWHWTVKAIAEDSCKARIKVEIFGENTACVFEPIALKEVEIYIEIKIESLWHKIYKWPGDHLDYIFESLMVPLVIYFWNERRKKRKKPR